jgi:hypothetical protein
MLRSFRRSDGRVGRAAASLGVVVLFLQAALPLVHHPYDSQFAGVGPTASPDGSVVLTSSGAAASQHQDSHESLLCLFCRALNRQEGQGVLAANVLEMAHATNGPLFLFSLITVPGDYSAANLSRAPPAL